MVRAERVLTRWNLFGRAPHLADDIFVLSASFTTYPVNLQ
jgi:hypothetical protein